MRQPLKKYAAALLAAVSGICLIAYALCLPRDLFPDTGYSTVLTDRNGNLLGARIAADGQWRFPPADSVPEKFAVAIIEFEDRWFRMHPGINPVSIARAAYRNIREGHVVSGAAQSPCRSSDCPGKEKGQSVRNSLNASLPRGSS